VPKPNVINSEVRRRISMLYPTTRTFTKPTEPYTIKNATFYKWQSKRLPGGITCYEWVEENPWWHPIQWAENKIKALLEAP